MNESTVERVYFNDPTYVPPRPYLAGPVDQVGIQACAMDRHWAMQVMGPLWDAFLAASKNTDPADLSERGTRALKFRDRQMSIAWGLS